MINLNLILQTAMTLIWLVNLLPPIMFRRVNFERCSGSFVIKATLKTLYNLTRVKVLQNICIAVLAKHIISTMNCICHYLFTFLIEINVGIVIIPLLKMCTVQVLYKTVNHGQLFFNIWRLFWLFNTKFCTFYLCFYFNPMAMLWPWWLWMEFGWTVIVLF